VHDDDAAAEGEDAAVVQDDAELFAGGDAPAPAPALRTTSGSGRSPKGTSQDATTRSSRLQSSATSSSRDRKVPAEVVHRKRRIVYKDDRAPFLMEVDDETDSDIVAVLNDWVAPVGFDMVNTLVRNLFPVSAELLLFYLPLIFC
jgi:hypothetical protein